MPPSSSPALSLPAPAPAHSLLLAVLLGSNGYQSFLAGPIAFSALPRPAFSTLQRKTFPIFFPAQALLAGALVATYPFASRGIGGSPGEGVLGPGSAFAADLLGGGDTGWSWGRGWAAAYVSAMLVANVANWLAIGPMTVQCMKERKHQGSCSTSSCWLSGGEEGGVVEMCRPLRLVPFLGNLIRSTLRIS